LVVFVKVTVSLYDPATRLFALLLIDTVTVVLAPAARLPLLDERSTQAAVLDALQPIDNPPVF
jgi:hypothetical protein